MLTGVHIPHLLTVRIRTLAITSQVALNLHLRKETSPTNDQAATVHCRGGEGGATQFLYVLAIF
jgi:hypothetical protein